MFCHIDTILHGSEEHVSKFSPCRRFNGIHIQKIETYPKYNGSTDPTQYIMSYQVVVASSGGDNATMAKSFIIALEGPALTWYTRLLKGKCALGRFLSILVI